MGLTSLHSCRTASNEVAACYTLGTAAIGRELVEGGSVVATLYYQAIPPDYLAQRFTDGGLGQTAAAGAQSSAHTRRLYYLASHLNLDDTAAAGWKLPIDRARAVIP
jgi:hypothetical protein